MGTGIAIVTLDGDALERRTAEVATKLCALRGKPATITWNGTEYERDGAPIGRSIQAVFAWLDGKA
jgi:hypothetical protein